MKKPPSIRAISDRNLSHCAVCGVKFTEAQSSSHRVLQPVSSRSCVAFGVSVETYLNRAQRAISALSARGVELAPGKQWRLLDAWVRWEWAAGRAEAAHARLEQAFLYLFSKHRHELEVEAMAMQEHAYHKGVEIQRAGDERALALALKFFRLVRSAHARTRIQRAAR